MSGLEALLDFSICSYEKIYSGEKGDLPLELEEEGLNLSDRREQEVDVHRLTGCSDISDPEDYIMVDGEHYIEIVEAGEDAPADLEKVEDIFADESSGEGYEEVYSRMEEQNHETALQPVEE